MSAPLLPDDFKNQIPQAGASLCGKLIPGLTSFMTNFSRWYSWAFTENGEISDAFAAEICALNCFSGPDNSTCPTVTLAANLIPEDTGMQLIIDGANMAAGYTYNIYRSTTDLAVGGAWGAAVYTGTTTGSRITQSDTGLVNGTIYYYKITVQKGGCDLYYVLANGTPALCRNLDLHLALAVTGNTGELRLKLTEPNGRMTTTLPVKVYRSTDSALLGTEIFNGTVNDHSATDEQGNQAFSLTDVGLEEGTQYYYTVKVQQDVSCTEYVVQASGRPTATFLTAPTLQKIGEGHYRWNRIAGADTYCIYRRAGTTDGFAPAFTLWRCVGDVTDLYITKPDWPCTYDVTPDVPNNCQAYYQFYVTAKITDTNVQSGPSNALSFNKTYNS